MTTFTAFNRIDGKLAVRISIPAEDNVRRWTARLFVSAALGAISGIAGLAIGFLTFSNLIVPSTGTYTAGTILIGASFVLFGLAAHCLDKSDAADKALRLEYCRQHGLNDECDAKKSAR